MKKSTVLLIFSTIWLIMAFVDLFIMKQDNFFYLLILSTIELVGYKIFSKLEQLEQ